MLIDITPPVHAGIAVWPGDVAFRRDVTCAIADGANLDLSSITTTVHVGAHADAPSHYAADGVGISQRPLERYYGPCQVVRVEGVRGRRIVPSDVTVAIAASRVLFHTDSFPDPDQWNDDFASLSPELVVWLADQGVTLVGLDTPSVDPMNDKVLHSHTAIASRDMAILEGVVLRGVEPGIYTLIALPLKLVGADASPVRAVLVRS